MLLNHRLKYSVIPQDCVEPIHIFRAIIIIRLLTHRNPADGPVMVPSENLATAGWFIGMMLAIVFLLLLLIIICIVKRNRGGKYDVHDRELAAGRRDYEEGGFHEYPQK